MKMIYLGVYISFGTKMEAKLRQKIRKLEFQRRTAWRMYYLECDESHAKDTRIYNLLQKQSDTKNHGFPTHLVNEFEELYDQLKKSVECPVCLDVIEKGKLKITACGHKVCIVCHAKVKKCPLCRRKI